MLRRAAKRLIGRAVRCLWRLGDRLDREAPAWPPDSRDVDYTWLNTLWSKLLDDGGAVLRPSYTWGVLHAVYLAKAIGVGRVSLLELGVAQGNGLLALEEAADRVEAIFRVGVDVYGFDTGAGLPAPRDYRDLPNLYVEGAYPMNVERLRRRLRRAELVLGPLERTAEAFLRTDPAPIAFASFDLDYYSSTAIAVRLLEAPHRVLLPRVHCYFDDIMGFTFSEFTGERLAIAEFNARHERRKLSPIFGLRHYLPESHRSALWPEKMYLAHFFDHAAYGRSDGLVRRPLPALQRPEEPRRPSPRQAPVGGR